MPKAPIPIHAGSILKLINLAMIPLTIFFFDLHQGYIYSKGISNEYTQGYRKPQRTR